jgi:hypothetical protein
MHLQGKDVATQGLILERLPMLGDRRSQDRDVLNLYCDEKLPHALVQAAYALLSLVSYVAEMTLGVWERQFGFRDVDLSPHVVHIS